MKHFNFGPENKDGLSLYMITQEGNNFGDQILTLKELKRTVEGLQNVYGYHIIAITSRSEGDWMQPKEMKMWLKNVKLEASK